MKTIVKIISIILMQSLILGDIVFPVYAFAQTSRFQSSCLAPHIFMDSQVCRTAVKATTEGERISFGEKIIRAFKCVSEVFKKEKKTSAKMLTKSRKDKMTKKLSELKNLLEQKKNYIRLKKYDKMQQMLSRLEKQLDVIALFTPGEFEKFEKIEKDVLKLEKEIRSQGAWSAQVKTQKKKARKKQKQKTRNAEKSIVITLDLGKFNLKSWFRKIFSKRPALEEKEDDIPVEIAYAEKVQVLDKPEGIAIKDPEGAKRKAGERQKISLYEKQKRKFRERIKNIKQALQTNNYNLNDLTLKNIYKKIAAVEKDIREENKAAAQLNKALKEIEQTLSNAERPIEKKTDIDETGQVVEVSQEPEAGKKRSIEEKPLEIQEEVVPLDPLREAVTICNPERIKLRPVNDVISELQGQIELLRAIISQREKQVSLVNVQVLRQMNDDSIVIRIDDKHVFSDLQNNEINIGAKLKDERWIELNVKYIYRNNEIKIHASGLTWSDFKQAQFWKYPNIYSEERQKDILKAIVRKLTKDGTTGIDVLDYVLMVKAPDKDISYDDVDVLYEYLGRFHSAAIEMILNTRFGLIHGPFGSGKTTAYIEAIKKLVIDEKLPVLVVTQQHSNADDITMRLGEDEQIPVLRFGNNPERFQEEVQSFSRQNTQAVKEFKQRFKDLNQGQKGQSGCLLTATLMGGSYDKVLSNLVEYKEKHGLEKLVVLIDEAGLVNYPELVTALYLLQPNSLILMGDHEQFSPYPLAAALNESEKKQLQRNPKINKKIVFRYETSLFKQLIGEPYNIARLLKNFRNHWVFVELAQRFYRNLTLKSFSKEQADPLEEDTLQIVDTSEMTNQSYAKRNKNRSWYNDTEAKWIVQKAKEFLRKEYKDEKKYRAEDITIVTPYNGQIERIKRFINLDEELYPWEKIRLNNNVITSRQVQGRENKVVLVSFVRSDATNGNGNGNVIRKPRYKLFREDPIISDSALLLVTITRAGEKMAMIGNKQTLDKLSYGMYTPIFNFVPSQEVTPKQPEVERYSDINLQAEMLVEKAI